MVKKISCILFIFQMLVFFLFLGNSGNSFATIPKNSAETVADEETESQQEMRRRLLTTVEAAKQYQDIMDDQLKSLKNENKDLHEKLMHLKKQFEAVMVGVASNFKENLNSTPSSVNAPSVLPLQSKVNSGFNSGVNSGVDAGLSSGLNSGLDAALDSGLNSGLDSNLNTHLNFGAPQTQIKQPAEVSPKPLQPSTLKEEHKNSESLQVNKKNTAPVPISLNGKDKLTAALSDLKLLGGVVVLVSLIMLWFVWGKGGRKVDLPNLKHVSKKNKIEGKGNSKNLSILAKQEVNTQLDKQMVVPLVCVNQEGEYDYMGSTEAIPAKLDLARMYIDMGDIAQAELVLKSIMAQGNEVQFFEAKKLMLEIGKKFS